MGKSYLEQTSELKLKIPNKLMERVKAAFKKKGLRDSLLVAFALEHELEKENPFHYDVTLPSEEIPDFSYVEEAQMIFNFLQKNGGMSLENLCIFRENIGISDKDTFLHAFKKLSTTYAIEHYKPRKNDKDFQYPDDHFFWRVRKMDRKTNDKIRRESSKFERHLKEAEKYKKQGLLP